MLGKYKFASMKIVRNYNSMQNITIDKDWLNKVLQLYNWKYKWTKEEEEEEEENSKIQL